MYLVKEIDNYAFLTSMIESGDIRCSICFWYMFHHTFVNATQVWLSKFNRYKVGKHGNRIE